MYRLLVADDEQIVIDSIRFIVEKHFETSLIVEGATNGKEAIEKVETFKPDIVFIDIHMPIIDGIAAIKEIRKRHSDIVFVILTAYNYFSYAQEAVNLKVLDYLLKPINKSKVVENLDKAIKLVEGKIQNLQNELEMKEKFDKIVAYLEHEFIYSSLLENEPYNNLAFYQETFNLNLEYGYVMVLNVEGKEINQKEENIHNSIIRHEMYHIFRGTLKSLADCLVGAVTLNRIIAFITIDQGQEEYETRNRAINLAEEIKKELKKKVNIPYSIGIGRVYDIEHFIKSYEEADKAIKLSHDEKITHISDKLLEVKELDFYPLNKEKVLIDKIIAGDELSVKLLFEEIFEWMRNNYHDVLQIQTRLNELSIVILRSLSYHGVGNTTEEQKTFMGICENNDLAIIKLDYLGNLLRITTSVKALRTKKMNKIIDKVTDYIQTNYAKDITLNDAAQEVNMSYHYFSKFFKDETGQNFTDYLMNIRIGKAKELLKSNQYSVKELCYMVGYKDPNYFSKIFKKYTGLAPTEYRDLI